MSCYSRCRKHGRIDPWGCRECLDEATEKTVAKAIEDVRRKIVEAFWDDPPPPTGSE